MGGNKTELIKFAFQGVNIIPTSLLILTQGYWVLASLGLFDFDFFDLDIEVETEGLESSGLLNALAVFMNIGQVPMTLVLSMLALTFWLLTMLMYFLPIAAGGKMAGVLLIPAFALSLLTAKGQIKFLRTHVFEQKSKNNVACRVLNKTCTLKSNLEGDQIGQAIIEAGDTSIVINVKTKCEDDSFEKNEVAFVLEKDQEKEVYYIRKL
ncbi:MAG: hypothetical protein JXO44_05985 [Clostridia bacterium]|nr:hypothetical protein [Clostridia bacterium]